MKRGQNPTEIQIIFPLFVSLAVVCVRIARTRFFFLLISIEIKFLCNCLRFVYARACDCDAAVDSSARCCCSELDHRARDYYSFWLLLFFECTHVGDYRAIHTSLSLDTFSNLCMYTVYPSTDYITNPNWKLLHTPWYLVKTLLEGAD